MDPAFPRHAVVGREARRPHHALLLPPHATAPCWTALPPSATCRGLTEGASSASRAAATSLRDRALLEQRFHPHRWMLFLEGFGRCSGHRADGGHARFFDLSAVGDHAFICVLLPEVNNHCILDSPVGFLRLQRDVDTAFRLIHPFTSNVADFQDMDCLPHQLHKLEFELTATSGFIKEK